MAYEKTNWSSGDVITAEKLNKIENGIDSYDEKFSNSVISVIDEDYVNAANNGEINIKDVIANAIRRSVGIVNSNNINNQYVLNFPVERPLRVYGQIHNGSIDKINNCFISVYFMGATTEASLGIGGLATSNGIYGSISDRASSTEIIIDNSTYNLTELQGDKQSFVLMNNDKHVFGESVLFTENNGAYTCDHSYSELVSLFTNRIPTIAKIGINGTNVGELYNLVSVIDRKVTFQFIGFDYAVENTSGQINVKTIIVDNTNAITFKEKVFTIGTT